MPLFAQLARVPDLAPHVFFATTGRKNAEPVGFDATPIEWKWSPSKRFYWMPAQLEVIDPSRFDVAIFEWNVHYLSLAPALIKAKRKNVKTILWGHGQSANDGTWRAWPRTSLARRADALVTYGEGACRRLMDAGFNGKSCFVASNAIDQTPIQNERTKLVEKFGSSENARSALRRELILSSDFVALFVSRLEELRRVDVLMRAIRKSKDAGARIDLIIVGDGPNRVALEQLVNELQINDQIKWAGAVYDESELAKYFLAADVFVFPSYMGLSALHAFGYGLPVITGDNLARHGPEAEAVVDGVTGLTFRHDDADDLSAKILKLKSDSQLRSKLSQAAHQTVLTRYSIKGMVAGLSEAIRYVAAK